MRRRDFIKGIVVSPAWPLAVRAQQPAMPVIGFLRSVSLADAADLVTAFRQGLKETGFIEGQNVAIELRSAEGHLDRLPALVGDLIRRPVAVIVGNLNAALAAKGATATIPIIFASGSDPVRDGLVASLNRPGGNITGVMFLVTGLGAKRLDLLRQLVPKANLIAMLVIRAALIPRPSEETYRPRRKGSGSRSSFSMPAANAILRHPLQRSCNAGPVR